jgi:hypothetical protein
MFRWCIVLCACAIWTMTGCGRSDLPELGSVTGTVTLQGKPLADAIVTFSPENGRPSKGTTDDSGRYELIYTQDAKGAMIGTHRVQITMIQTPEEDDLPEGAPAPNALPPEATDNSITKEVASGANEIAIEL